MISEIAKHNCAWCRVSYLDAVVSSFGTLMAAHRGEVVCSVTTAKALDGAMQKEVEAAVKGFLKGSEKALINYSVDPAIIGGMVSVNSLVNTNSCGLICIPTARSSPLATSSAT